ncbi:MAG: ComEA family DNA-binding protein [Gemmatimonadaceae bacterium]
MDRADAAALVRLPRIGPVLAARIIADRDSLGAFGSLERLQRVRGIGPAMARSLAPHVTFSGTPRPLSAAPVGPRGARSPFHGGGPVPPAPARRSRPSRPRPTPSPTHDRSLATWPSPLPRPPSASATC